MIRYYNEIWLEKKQDALYDALTDIENILNYDSLNAISAIDEVIKKGKDLRQFTFELTSEFLNRLVKSNENIQRYVR